MSLDNSTMLFTSTQSTILTNISTSLSSTTTLNDSPLVEPTQDPSYVVTPDYEYYYDYSYNYFFISVFLSSAGLLIAMVARYKRQQMKREAAIRRIQQHAVATGAPSNSTTVPSTPQPPRDDLPPTYTEVMQSYINQKESIEVNAVETGMTPAASTVTIETNISTTNLAPGTPNALPPAYESTLESGATTITITEEQR